MVKIYDIVVALDLGVDLIAQCGNVTPIFGQTEQLIPGYSLELGGSNSIFACQAAKLGLKVAGVGTVGNDYLGKYVLSQLQNSGVNISHIKQTPDEKTGIGIALAKGSDRAILTYNGTFDGVLPSDLSTEVLSKARHLHIGSYFIMTKLQPRYKEILQAAKKLGLTISLDTNWDPSGAWMNGIDEILPLVDVFLPNENEALLISKRKDLKQSIDYLRKIVPILVIKKGANGAEVFSKTIELSVKTKIPACICDTVGAGDSFDAGFIYAWLHNNPLLNCLKAGVFCGSKSVEKTGGINGQPSIKYLTEYLNQ